MNSEKVKEIKKALECCANWNGQSSCKDCPIGIEKCYEDENLMPRLALTLINELESENEELKKYRCDWLNSEKMHLQADMEDTEFELASSNRLFEIVSKENQTLKDRIALLEKENETLRNANVVYETVDYCAEDLRKAEERIAELEEELKEKSSYAKGYADGIRNTYEEVLPEFAERLKEKCNDKNSFICSNSITVNDIDETLNEFLGK